MTAPSTDDVSGQGSPPTSVLLIDGDGDYAAFLADAFAGRPSIGVLHVKLPGIARVQLRSRAFDVVLVALGSDAGTARFELLEEIARLDPAPPAIAIIPEWDESLVIRALRAGAQDYVLRTDTDVRTIARTIRHAVERQRVREHARQSNERFRSLIENALDMIGVVDSGGVMLYQSPAAAQIFGVAAADLTGRSLFDFVHDGDAPALRRLLADVFAGPGGAQTATCRIQHADQSWHTLEMRAWELKGRDHELPQGILNVRDVTDRERAEQALRAREAELRQSQKLEAIGRLAGGIAHDFSNLLTVITAASDRLVEQLPAGHDLRRDADSVKASAERAVVLTRQILAFSRQQVSAPTVVNLNDVLGGLERFIRPLLGERIDCRVIGAPGLGSVRVDQPQFEQVFVNLAVNARDAMPSGGQLTFETANAAVDGDGAGLGLAPGRYVMVRVSDSGHGMAADVLGRAFEPFFTTKEVGQGTGLGLSIVHGTVSQHGGAVKLVSQPGTGTTVTMYLPRVDAQADRPVERSERPRAAAASGSETVLLVEDEDAVRELVRDMLGMAGYRVVDAARPTIAEQRCREFDGPIHLLLTDVVMPEMSGPDLARRIKELRPGIKVLFMSGYPEHVTLQGSAPAPDMPLVPKPFNRRLLLERVRGVLDNPASP
jgi:PAS domain S-box-containing protein